MQNQAYERNGRKVRISHENLYVQGIERLPTIQLSRINWPKEQRRERTSAGDRKRAIEVLNKARTQKKQREVSYHINLM